MTTRTYNWRSIGLSKRTRLFHRFGMQGRLTKRTLGLRYGIFLLLVWLKSCFSHFVLAHGSVRIYIFLVRIEINPNILLAWLQILLICVAKFMSLSKCTPKSFMLKTAGIWLPLRLNMDWWHWKLDSMIIINIPAKLFINGPNRSLEASRCNVWEDLFITYNYQIIFCSTSKCVGL